MRLIDADELITAFPCGESVRTESVRATINHMPTIPSTATDTVKALREAEYRGYMKAVADRPQEWIPCKERLPKEAEPILVTINGKTYFAPFGINEESSKELGTVAWMPLPEPWKGADDE